MENVEKSMEKKFNVLNRVPELKIIKEFDLSDGTHIAIRQVKARLMLQNVTNKKMSDVERGMRVMAAKLLVNGEPIQYEDMLDCFNDEEITLISQHLVDEEDGEEGKND